MLVLDTGTGSGEYHVSSSTQRRIFAPTKICHNSCFLRAMTSPPEIKGFYSQGSPVSEIFRLSCCNFYGYSGFAPPQSYSARFRNFVRRISR